MLDWSSGSSLMTWKMTGEIACSSKIEETFHCVVRSDMKASPRPGLNLVDSVVFWHSYKELVDEKKR